VCGFSQMNSILTLTRASSLTKTVNARMFIRLVGPLLRVFHPLSISVPGSWNVDACSLITKARSGNVKIPAIVWKLFFHCSVDKNVFLKKGAD
jgi:hypothetical protein